MTACKVGRLVGSTHALNQPDRAILRAWLDTGQYEGRRVSAALMAQALTAEGHPVGPTAVKDHRGKRCVCFREDVTA